jgi:1,4-alpha-glucan branching enzyme
MITDPDLQRLVEGFHHDPHSVLGLHDGPDGAVVRVRRPEAVGVWMELDGQRCEGRHLLGGVFEIPVPRAPRAADPVHVEYDAFGVDVVDPYRFWPTLGDVDLHLIGEGRHERLWAVLGARPMAHDGVDGVAFAVWAPAAEAVRVVGDWNSWDGRIHPMRALGASGVWELFVPEAEVGHRYRYEIVGADGHLRLKSDPLAREAEMPPANASVITRSSYTWSDDDWMAARRSSDPIDDRLSIYEVHAGSWRTVPEEGDRPLRWDELAEQLADHVVELGFTHIELLPMAEHPFAASWGYQVTGYFAPTSRFGSPDDFRAFVDQAHRRGIGIIVDWVPAHFPKDDHAGPLRRHGPLRARRSAPGRAHGLGHLHLQLRAQRGEELPRLLRPALAEEFHVDGLRVDAVASMLYLDYSRETASGLPNEHGGRENLEAIAFLRRLDTITTNFPGVMMIAEESTAWGGVSRPTDLRRARLRIQVEHGLDERHPAYFQARTGPPPIPPRRAHLRLDLRLDENFVLVLSHDEVVHGKGSLLGKMPGDRLAAVRQPADALYAWMWAHPGKQLLFMGCELAQGREWSESRSLDWHLLDHPQHAGVQRLVAALNRAHAEHPAMWQRDTEPAGFDWLDASDAAQSVLAFQRNGHGDEPPVVCLANFTPVPRHGYRVGLPRPGAWREVLNTDDDAFGGSGVGNGTLQSEDIPWQGRDWSAVVTLPPLAVVWFSPEG